MSGESISHKEDKEDLIYIFRKIKLENYLPDDTIYEKNSSSSSDDSILPSKTASIDYDVNVYNTFGKQVGPEIFNDPEMFAKTKPFDFLWTYGFNSKIEIINLTSVHRTEILFVGAHFPILYNYCSKQMKCLEGHHAPVSSISADSTGVWVATADEDKQGCVLIWESTEFKTVCTLFNIYAESGTILVKLSWSARYLVTVGIRNGSCYSVDIWQWTLGKDDPESFFEIDKRDGVPVEVCFNPNIEEFIMVICKKQVYFLVWDPIEKKFTKSKNPHITHRDRIGTLTTGTYLTDCHECYVCSNKGCVLIFGSTIYTRPFPEAELDNMKSFKSSVKISEYAILSCVPIASTLVIGDENGTIFFFDRTVKILYWFLKFNLAPVVSISFSSMSKFKDEDLFAIYTAKPQEDQIFECGVFSDITPELEMVYKIDLPKDATLKNNPLLVNDFFVATADSNIYAIDFLKNSCVPLFMKADDNVCAIEVHDESPYILIGYANGKLNLVDYEKNQLIVSSSLPESEDYNSMISCLKYSSDSIHLICGTDSGQLWVLEPILLKSKIDVPFQITQNRVQKIAFSPNKEKFAYYDTNMTVVLFKYDFDEGNWKCSGKVRSHYGPINDILFLPKEDGFVLYTIASDRHLVEYFTSPSENFRIACRDRIEQKAIPMCFMYWYEIINNEKIGYFLVADNEHKFKFLVPDSKVPKSVVLAPAFGCFQFQNITKMMIIPKTKGRYMIFLANNYLGVHILPPDGNPYSYVGYFGHPKKVADFVLSPDGKYIFSFGMDARCVFKWRIKTKAVDLMHILGGKELEPFYCLIEGGKNGWLFQEIKDLFYYMQILQHEDTSSLPRRVSDYINVTDVPELVRTCGFYPSDFELENIMIDVKHRNYQGTGNLNKDINFIDFVKVFCNHKPVYGYSREKILEAFETIVKNADYYSDEISRDEFASILSCSGESITPSYLSKLFKTLLRSEDSDTDLDFLPEYINFQTLYEDILGIDMGRCRVSSSMGSEECEG